MLEAIEDVQAAGVNYTPSAGGLNHSNTDLGRGLRLCSQLLKAGVPLEVAALHWSIGWDTPHSDQIATTARRFTDQTKGYQRALTTGASDRLAAGRDELAALIPVTDERPLFQADRRPVPPPEAPAPPVEATLVLVGILSDGTERIALVRRSSSPQLFQIEPGGSLGPWQIISVDLRSISVRKDDGSTFTLQLDG